VLALLAAAALAYAATRPSPRAAPFRLAVSPSQRSVRPGSAARYTISLRRQGFRGAIKLSVTGSPRYLQAHLARGRTAHRTLVLASSAQARGARYTLALTVKASPRTPGGSYRMVVRARGGRYSKSVRLRLTVPGPHPVAFGISGSASGLAPGTPRALNLTLRNPTRSYLWVTGLAVTATAVSAPNSSPQLPCTLDDFAIRQFSGGYPFLVRPGARSRLSDLAYPAWQQPQITLVNRSSNQDGCTAATVKLSYSGQGFVP
jgi:hypothetical protein